MAPTEGEQSARPRRRLHNCEAWLGRVDASLSRVVAGDIQASAQHGKLAAEAGLATVVMRFPSIALSHSGKRRVASSTKKTVTR